MKVYNTMTREKEEFTPENNTVRMYSCGPTVYNFAHIGNLRTYVFMDILRRTLKYEGYIRRQLKQVEDFRRMEDRPLPENIDYAAVPGLRTEARQKLVAIRPVSFGQASRISGVSPADMTALMIYTESGKERRHG